MLKYLTMGCGVALLIVSIGCYELYQHGESLAKDLATQTANVETLKKANETDQQTIKTLQVLQQSISETQQAINDGNNAIAQQVERTKWSIKNQIKGLPCYDQTIPDTAIDAVCSLQPSNPACTNRN